VLSVIVPAYRSASTICETLEVLLTSLRRLDVPSEVVLVPDGNLDDTAAQVAARAYDGVRIVEYADHRGKGYAIRQGMAHCRGDFIAYIDADLELHPDGLGPLLELVLDGADVALGSKRHPLSRIRYPLFRRVQSWLYQTLVRVLFDLRVTDTQTGMKVFRGDAVRAVLPTLTSDGFAFDLELLTALHDRGAVFAEGPVKLDYRYASTIGVGAVVRVFLDTFRIYGMRRRRRTAGRTAEHHAARAGCGRLVEPDAPATAIERTEPAMADDAPRAAGVGD
jgi:dolichol-phosphate mannosyltransferase